MPRPLQLPLPLDPPESEKRLPPPVEEGVIEVMALLLLQVLIAVDAKEVEDDPH